MSDQVMTCAVCQRRCRLRGPEGREAAQKAGWRFDLLGKVAWCGEHAEEALSGKDARLK
jgi:hypothetical protein